MCAICRVCFTPKADTCSALVNGRQGPMADISGFSAGTICTRQPFPLEGGLAGHISRRHRPECGDCGFGSVTLFVDLQVGWRDVGKDSAQRVQPTCLAGCKAAHRTSLAAVVETITECATTNDRFDCHD